MTTGQWNKTNSQPIRVLFDPTKNEAELYDSLAEEQCRRLTKINSSQLRRFFGEIKELYRQFNSLTVDKSEEETEKVYHEKIEPLFKMVRSKVSYATRAGGQAKLPRDFAQLLSEGISKVKTHQHFKRFVLHLEAVVGFMYGSKKVGR